MSLAATIMARLGLDTKGFSDGIRQAGSDSDKFSRRLNTACNAHDRLLGSSRRVACQMQNFVRDMASEANATDLFSAGLEGLEKSLRLPIGASAGLGIGAVLISQAAKTREELKKLNEEIQKLLAAPGTLGSDPLMTVEERPKASTARWVS